MHGEYKTPGGKLVAVDFDVQDEKLTNVLISGDFFLYPDEAIEPIRAALDGLPLRSTEQEIVAAVVQAIEPGVSLVGFSPEAIAIAVRRGVASYE